jgi:gliding motility-associated-like protein
LPTAAGTYTYSYSVNLDGNCTSDTAQVSLVVREGVGQITLGSNGPLECVANTDSIKLTATGGQNVQSYAWTGPNGFTSSAQNPSLLAANNAAGTYVLVATAPGGCQTRDSINVAVTAQGIAPMITIGGGKTNICEGDELSLSVDTIQGATYAWSGPNNFASTDQNVKIANTTVSNAGAYQLVVTVNGCTSAPRTVGPINILTDPDINADAVDAIVNQSMTFNVTTNDTLIAGVPFTISVVSGAKNGTLTNNNDGTFGYQPKSNFAGTDQIAYEICYTDCSSLCGMAVVTIRTEYPKDSCVVPTLVSPNGDGFNDALFISCVSSPPKQGSELIIWNEWGSEVYRKEAYDNSWQGTYNGKDLPDGTYYYVYKRDSDDNNPQKGYFTLFR